MITPIFTFVRIAVLAPGFMWALQTRANRIPGSLTLEVTKNFYQL